MSEGKRLVNIVVSERANKGGADKKGLRERRSTSFVNERSFHCSSADTLLKSFNIEDRGADTFSGSQSARFPKKTTTDKREGLNINPQQSSNKNIVDPSPYLREMGTQV